MGAVVVDAVAVGVDVVERYAVPWTMVFGMKDR